MNTSQPELQHQEKKPPVRCRLKQWFNGVSGSTLYSLERNLIEEELPDLFGYHILQLGLIESHGLLGSSRISHQILVEIAPQDTQHPEHLLCRSSQLPIAANSVDVVLIQHVLEFENDPHEVLREVERILIGEGHLLIIGFNPWSLMGIWRALLAWRDEPPWCGHFYRAGRIRDWLALLGFDVIKTRYMFFSPPIGSRWLMKRFTFFEKLGNYLCPWLGGGYLVIGKKRLIPLTPTRTEWRIRRSLIAAGVAEPSARIKAELLQDALEVSKSKEFGDHG